MTILNDAVTVYKIVQERHFKYCKQKIIKKTYSNVYLNIQLYIKNKIVIYRNIRFFIGIYIQYHPKINYNNCLQQYKVNL
jgi:hypothetical protein